MVWKTSLNEFFRALRWNFKQTSKFKKINSRKIEKIPIEQTQSNNNVTPPITPPEETINQPAQQLTNNQPAQNIQIQQQNVVTPPSNSTPPSEIATAKPTPPPEVTTAKPDQKTDIANKKESEQNKPVKNKPSSIKKEIYVITVDEIRPGSFVINESEFIKGDLVSITVKNKEIKGKITEIQNNKVVIQTDNKKFETIELIETPSDNKINWIVN